MWRGITSNVEGYLEVILRVFTKVEGCFAVVWSLEVIWWMSSVTCKVWINLEYYQK